MVANHFARKSRFRWRLLVVLLLAIAWTASLAPIIICRARAMTRPTGPSDSGGQNTKALAFEVVSIRPSKPGSLPAVWPKVLPDGYRATNQSIWSTIMLAYFSADMSSWRRDRVVGAPPWAGKELYDIEAKVSAADVTEWQRQGPQKEMLRAMLRTMLKQRCKLLLHSTTSEAPIYALVVGKHGPKLKEATAGEKFPPHSIPLPDGGADIPYRTGETPQLTFFGAPMASLAEFLSWSSERPVQDQTGLTGEYDFVLQRRDEESMPETDPEPATPWAVEDLGLALKPAKASAVTLVIEHIERPSPNYGVGLSERDGRDRGVCANQVAGAPEIPACSRAPRSPALAAA
jgi:uncharacterized protein (TIGR03435 family)